jgi:hypothetical protein
MLGWTEEMADRNRRLTPVKYRTTGGPHPTRPLRSRLHRTGTVYQKVRSPRATMSGLIDQTLIYNTCDRTRFQPISDRSLGPVLMGSFADEFRSSPKKVSRAQIIEASS